MVIITLGCAFVTQAIGVQAVFGAFSAGAMLGNGSARARRQDRDELEALTLGFLAPIFFAYSGLKADVSTLSDPLIAAIILAIACGASSSVPARAVCSAVSGGGRLRPLRSG